MADPAELLLIKDRYESALASLSHGLAAEESERRPEALAHLRQGRLLLSEGLEVPTSGERCVGAAWDTARQLQQKMKNTINEVNAHLSALENSEATSTEQTGLPSNDLPFNMYPDITASSQSALSHLYPTIPSTMESVPPAPWTAPMSPDPPVLEQTDTLPTAPVAGEPMDGAAEQPPAYTPKPTDGHRSLGYGPPREGACQSGEGAAAGDGNELLSIPSGVQLFFVEPDGQVGSMSYPGYLRITTSDHQDVDSSSKPSSVLHVCDQVIPLTADTPVLLANCGIFMFPDATAESPGSFIGIVLSSELPAADHEMFQDLLSQLTDLRTQNQEEMRRDEINLSVKVPLGPPAEANVTHSSEEKDKPLLPGWSEKMAQGILSGASRLSQSLAKGAEATGRVIHKGAARIRDRITPEETPSEVSPGVSKGLQAAKQATGGAVRASQFLVNGASALAGHVAGKVAPHVKKHGAKLVPETMKKSRDGQGSDWDGTKHVAASSFQGFSTIWSSLEAGAKNVCKSVASETVQTVSYKYGRVAGDATDTALQSVANVGLTAYNFDNLSLLAFLKTTGGETSKTLLNVNDKQLSKNEDEGKTQPCEKAEERKNKDSTEDDMSRKNK